MGSLTRVYMSATFPEHSALESVGSVAANFARTSEEEQRKDLNRSSHGSDMAGLIRSIHGMAAYQAYINEMQQKHEADARQLAKQQARQMARRAAMKKFCRRLRASIAKFRNKSK